MIIEEKVDLGGDRNTIEISVNGVCMFSVYDECDSPEDNNLMRNFNDCLKIVSLMQAAYDAGRRGEDFKIKE